MASDAEKWNSYATRMNNTRGVTGVVFEVTREGSVVALDLIHPSGTLELDRSVQKTLRNVLLPPLPSDYPDESLRIQAGFYYNVTPPE
jgi:TonB family protein